MTLRVPLIRVEGKSFSERPPLTMTPERFAAGAQLEREARDRAARDAEVAFGFEPSLYFYAGVAHPSFGDIVLAYHPETSTQLPGSMSTFDTGGMYLGHIHGRGLVTADERAAYVKCDICTLDGWRQRASTWISDNFESVDDYIDPGGRPKCNDPTDRLGHQDNEKRAWTVEVRLYVDRDIFEDLAFILVRQEFLQRALQASQSSSADNERLLRLVSQGTLIQTGTHPCGAAIEHVRTYIQASQRGA